jgi:cytochrome c oxidase subunit 3
MSHSAVLDTPAHGHTRSLAPFGMLVFLASEAMLFAGLIGGYIVLRVSSGQWIPSGDEVPMIRFNWAHPSFMNLLMVLNTVFLISSSFTFHFAEAAVLKGKSGSFWLFVSISLGLVFLGIQGFEWHHLKEEGLWFPVASTAEHTYSLYGPYGSTFFTMTGFHGFHVFIGVLLLTTSLLKSLTGCFSAENHTFLAIAGYYWHFVDVVWVFLFGILYFW